MTPTLYILLGFVIGIVLTIIVLLILAYDVYLRERQ